jgi:hypothetical protein
MISLFSHKSTLVALISVIALIAVSANPAQAIIYRHDVDDSEFLQPEDAYPAVFDVFEKRGGVATLIAPQWAITVGHVGQDIPQGHTVVLAGQSYEVRRVVLHPEWAGNRREMALFELDRPVENVEPLVAYENDDEGGKVVTFVGRGDSGTGLTGAVNKDHKLRAATNRVERVEGGMLVFIFNSPDDDNVTDHEGVSGPGDSGGPAFIDTPDGLRVAGLSVASSGRPPGRYGNTEFYSRVSTDITWIRETLGTTGSPVQNSLENASPANDLDSGNSPKSNIAIYISGVAVLVIVAISTIVWRRKHAQNHGSG